MRFISQVQSAAVGPAAARQLLPIGRARRDGLLDSALALIVAVAAAFLIFHRLDIGAWFDEAFSYGISTQPLGSYISTWAWGDESNMVAYYLGLRGWLALLSLAGVAPVEVLLRLPSATFAIASAVVVFLLGRSMFGRAAGFVAAVLYMTNFLQMILAQTARSYTLELFLIGLSWLFLYDGLKTGRRRQWLGYAAATSLAVYAALFSGLVIIAEVVAVGLLAILPGPWRAQVRRAVLPLGVSWLASFILVAPLILDAVIHGGPTWVKPVQANDFRLLVHTLSGGSHAYAILVLGAAATGLILAWAARTTRFARFSHARGDHLGPAVALASWLVVPIVLSAALTQPGLNLHLFYTRYLDVVVPPLCLLAGLAVSALPARPLQAVGSMGIVLIALPPLSLYYQTAQVADYRTPAQWLQQRYQAGDGVVCDPAVQCAIPFDYYFAAYPGGAHLDADSPGFFDWRTGSSVPVSAGTVEAYGAKHKRIFFIYAPLQRSPTGDKAALVLEQQLIADGYTVIDRTGQVILLDT